MDGTEHWARKGDIKLFLWRKNASKAARGTILFVHGSSIGSQPTFDLHVPGRPHSSAMEWFAGLGYDTWCMDNEGYGRSDKWRDINCDIANGADDLAAGSEYVLRQSGAKKLLVYGISSGALKAALFAQRHPERVARLALDAFVWTGEGSPTLEQRKKRLPEFQTRNRRPIDRAFVHSIFEGDHRSLRRRDPQARRFSAHRHLRRHVLQAAARRSREAHGADDHHARRIRR